MAFIEKIRSALSFGQHFISGFVIMIITMLSAGYATAGLMILFSRNMSESITAQEVTLILAFAGVQGFVYSIYKKNGEK
jgi:hypothetical protein